MATERRTTLVLRELAPEEIVTANCKQQVPEGDFIGVFTHGIPASEYANPVFIVVDHTEDGI